MGWKIQKNSASYTQIITVINHFTSFILETVLLRHKIKDPVQLYLLSRIEGYIYGVLYAMLFLLAFILIRLSQSHQGVRGVIFLRISHFRYNTYLNFFQMFLFLSFGKPDIIFLKRYHHSSVPHIKQTVKKTCISSLNVAINNVLCYGFVVCHLSFQNCRCYCY